MKKVMFLFGFLLFAFAFSQEENTIETFVEEDTIKGGSLTITMDDSIDLLLEQKEKTCDRVVVVNNDKTDGKKIVARKDVCAELPKLSGYRIQILYTKNIEDVNKTRTEFSKYFPGIPTDSKYIRPDYKVFAGEYFTRESASADLKRIKKKYPSALAVRATVFCKRAK